MAVSVVLVNIAAHEQLGDDQKGEEQKYRICSKVQIDF